MVEHVLFPSAAIGRGVWVPGPPTGPGALCIPFDPDMIRTSGGSTGTTPTIYGTFPLHREWSHRRIADRVRISGCDTANAPTVGPFPMAPVPDCHGYLPDPFQPTERHRGGDSREIARLTSERGERRPGPAEPFSDRCCSVMPGRRNW